MRRMFSLKQLEEIADRRVQAVASSGDLENVKVFENIVDKDGHKRFIEGDIELDADMITAGFTGVYGRWSLSGTHLMIVLAFNNTSGASISIAQWTRLFQVELPKWVYDKIYPANTGGSVIGPVSSQVLDISDPSSAGSPVAIYFEKDSGTTKLNCVLRNTITVNTGLYIRTQYDLVIDND